MNPQFGGIDMKINTLPVSFLLVFLLVFSVCQPVRADVMKLIPLLTKNLGVTEPQAKGGAGAIFDYVKQKASAEDFAKVTSALPGVDSLVESAPKTSDLSRQVGGFSPGAWRKIRPGWRDGRFNGKFRQTGLGCWHGRQICQDHPGL